MKKLFALIATFWCVTAAVAGNYPERSDFLWVTMPDHSDWLYSVGEPATVDVTLYEFGVPAAGKTVSYSIGPDMLEADTSAVVTLDAKGRAVIPMGTMTEPGFRDLRLAADFDGRRTEHHVKVGFSPERLQPYTQNPADFDDFWAKALAEDAKTPLKYTVEPAPEYTTDKMTCQLVKLELPGPWVTSMYGYLFIPKGEGKYPAVLCPPGAGVKTIKDPLFHRYYGEGGMIRAEIEIHGADPRLSEAEFAELRKEKGAYLDFGMESPDKYYMRDVYLGVRRWLDLLTQLPEYDGENLFVQGGSQGGALAITTSALDPRVKGCVSNHPALSDMNGYLGPKTGGYPHHFRKNKAEGTPDKVRTLEYYDVCNFARRLKCPVRMSWGYNDNTCPPTTSWEVWNLITAPKDSLITPINEHWTSANTERGHYDWIKSKCK